MQKELSALQESLQQKEAEVLQLRGGEQELQKRAAEEAAKHTQAEQQREMLQAKANGQDKLIEDLRAQVRDLEAKLKVKRVLEKFRDLKLISKISFKKK